MNTAFQKVAYFRVNYPYFAQTYRIILRPRRIPLTIERRYANKPTSGVATSARRLAQLEFVMQLKICFQSLLLTAYGAILMSVESFAQTSEADYRVKAGDILRIAVWGEQDLQDDVVVAPDGLFAFPLVGHVDARGQTASQLQETVRERLATYIAAPVVTVSIAEIKGNKVYVIGQVEEPGEYVMISVIDVMQALSIAGGTTTFARLDDILILRRAASGQKTFPFRYSSVIRGRDLEQNIQLESGDIVMVP